MTPMEPRGGGQEGAAYLAVLEVLGGFDAHVLATRDVPEAFLPIVVTKIGVRRHGDGWLGSGRCQHGAGLDPAEDVVLRGRIERGERFEEETENELDVPLVNVCPPRGAVSGGHSKCGSSSGSGSPQWLHLVGSSLGCPCLGPPCG